MSPPLIVPPLPVAIPVGDWQENFSFLSDTYRGLQADQKHLRVLAKQDANGKLQNFRQQVMALPVPSPRVVGAQGPHVLVIHREWVVFPDPAGIAVVVEYVVHLWSKY